MRVFIVAGSPQAKRPDGLAPGPGDRVIAADSGAVHARAWGWPVHLLVGGQRRDRPGAGAGPRHRRPVRSRRPDRSGDHPLRRAGWPRRSCARQLAAADPA
ncbi:MAG: hypothetical protein NT169_01470 [Chloroflexi bacterium]|nr:hypothetical protein [Chloroflexota bacterium]